MVLRKNPLIANNFFLVISLFLLLSKAFCLLETYSKIGERHNVDLAGSSGFHSPLVRSQQTILRNFFYLLWIEGASPCVYHRFLTEA